ncbi:MAG TPA: tyrosine-type recombinase/integrase [Thermoguttaceae bacterium]|nr:tyrosine-type recombinase/integrase [Thermoguttaceae bacterium]
MPLLDEKGKRIRGKDSRQAAELSLARVKVAGQWRPTAEPSTEGEWLVAKVCSEYIEYCRRGVARDTISEGYRDEVVRYLNKLVEYCGAMPISQLTKGHVQHWVESHPTWRSPVTRRNAITIVLAALNHARDMHDVLHRLKGLKKPPSRPRLHSFTEDDEAALYDATDEVFGDFLFAAIHTGLRPFCELARITADEVLETNRGVMWRVHSSKTDKTRKIPVRSEVADLLRRLMETAPPRSGIPLFRNTQGKPWKKVTGAGRFLRIKEKLGWDKDPVRKKYSCYTCRHTFAHRMLSGFWNGGIGCSIETLAELMGDTPKVAFDHYGREWGQHFQDPLWAAIGAGNMTTTK